MSQRNTRPNYRPGSGGYQKNFGHRNQGTEATSAATDRGEFNRVIRHTRPVRPPRLNLSNVRSYINEANDVDLERNAAAAAARSYNETSSSRSESGYPRYQQKRPPRRVTISENVRQIAPRLAIGDEKTQVPLLASKPYCQLACLPNEGFQIITDFVQNYFKCFDSKRDDLLNAYHTKALFSMSVNVTRTAVHNPYRFGDLIKESRNLRHIPNTDTEKRFRLVHVGHIDTVNALRNLPVTEHLMESLKLDVTFYNPSSPILTFSVEGVFKEGPRDANFRIYRAFQRVFVCISINGRIGIINEQYSISNMSIKQFKNYVKEDRPVPEASTPAPAPAVSVQDQKNALIQKFSQENRLTETWADSILAYVEWDYAKAMEAFNQQRSNLPPEAFI